MSLLPYILSELEDMSYPNIYDQNFGLGFYDHDLFGHQNNYRPSRVLSIPFRSGYLRPWRHTAENDSGISNYNIDKDGLKVNLDVQQFKPEEINVKVVDDYIVINAKHEERSDQHGFISREFTRRYKIPPTVNSEALASKLSSDGILTIQAPKKQIENNTGERSIPVIKTNKPAAPIQDGKNNTKKNPEKMES